MEQGRLSMENPATAAWTGQDLSELKASLQVMAEQQSMQLDMFVEMAKLLSHMVAMQKEQMALLEARGVPGAESAA
jgi:hypothetical protein